MDNFTLDRIAEWLNDDDSKVDVNVILKLAKIREKEENSYADDIVLYESDIFDDYKKEDSDNSVEDDGDDFIENSEDDPDPEDFYDPV